MKKNNILTFILMHLGFLLYSFYTVTGKIASKFNFFSFHFCLFYSILLIILFIYAILWQQVLKSIPLSFATANKSITIFWGMLWSFLFFKEEIDTKEIIGASIIIVGIIMLSKTTKSNIINEN